MNETQNLLGSEPIGKLLLKYSIPAIISMLVNALYNVIDRIFIGNMPGAGPLAIAGVGVTMPITTILLAFGMLIGIGSTTVISIKLGQGKKDDADKILANSITLSAIIGLILTLIGILFANKILLAFGASDQSLYYAKSFCNIILLGSVFNIMAFSLNATIRGDGNPRLSAMIMVIGCIVNIVLDYIFIFVLKIGIQGAALATVIAQIVTAILGLNYYIKGKSNLTFKKENLKLDKDIIKAIFGIGISPFSMQIAASLVQVISNNALKVYGGDIGIGAMATISSIAMIFLMPLYGINQGSQPIIGFNYGKKQYDRSKKAFTLSLIFGIILLTFGFISIWMYPEFYVVMFNSDPKLVAVTSNGLRKYCLMLPLLPIIVLGTNYLQSIGKAKQAMFLSLLRQVLVLIPMILILPKFMQLNGIWYAQSISDATSIVIAFIMLVIEFRSYKKLPSEKN